MSKSPLKIGLAGFGNVGAGVYKNLRKNQAILRERTGRDIEVHRVAVRDIKKKRDVELPKENVTTDLSELVNDKEIELVVELIGGIDKAFEFVKQVLEAGKMW